ncbi:hypothetical protein ACHWQZ_G004320 [Mnemiopsis leidyi]
MGSRKGGGSSLKAGNASDDRIDEMSGLYSALHDFQCDQQHVLNFKKDQIVEVTKASSSANWHRGRINGKAGFLPANGYLQKVDLESCPRVVVRQDFEGATSGQLKIYEGQVVTVVARTDVQWWTVRSDSGKWGQVPAKFLKMVNGSTEGEVTVHTPIESPDIVVSRPLAPLSRTQSQLTTTIPPDLSSVPRSSTISRTTAQEFAQLVRNDRTLLHLLQPPQNLNCQGDYSHQTPGSKGFYSYQTPESKRLYSHQTIGSKELSSQITPGSKGLYSYQTPESKGLYNSPDKDDPDPVILYDSIRQSTPAKPRRSKPSSRYKSRRKQRSIRAARYDFKSGKIVDVSLASVGSETPSFLDSIYSQNMSSVREEDYDDNVFHSGPNTTFQTGPDTTFDADPDTTFQEVLRHRRPPSEAHRFFGAVFASPISKKAGEEPRLKEAGTSTSDLTFSCSSCSCVRCPQSVCYPPQGAVQVEVVANLPVWETDPRKSLSQDQISSLYPMELSKSPYSRPTRDQISNLHKTSSDIGTTRNQDRSAGKCGSIESSKENIPAHNTLSFHNQVDKFLTELDQLRFSKLELEDREAVSPVSPVQVRTRLFQTNRKSAPGNKLGCGGGSRGVPHTPSNKRRDYVRISSSLVEGVRRNGVKYQTSKDIVQTVLEKLTEEYPEWNDQLSGLYKALHQESDLQSNSVDSLKLEQLFENLAAHTEDEQQRGWSCQDDTAEISSMLEDLLGLLRNANPKVVIHVLQSLKYEPLLTLVNYYQLESRKGLKKQALQVLYESMQIQPDPICSILLTSRLPVQLAADIQANKVMSLLEQQCDVFCSCLSYPNAMPRNHYGNVTSLVATHLQDYKIIR